MISQVSLLLGISFVLTVTFFGIYLAMVKSAGKKKWKLILYMVITGILAGLISILGFSGFTTLSIWSFIAAQAWLLALGILHTMFFEKIIPLENKNTQNILFTLALCSFGYCLVFLIYKFHFLSPFPRMFFLPAFFFIAPGFVNIAFNNFLKIPSEIYNAWDFPVPGSLPDPTDNEMADPIIINFEIRKKQADSRTVFKVKAPKAMDLGRLFYFFIIDYNSRHSNNPISVDDNSKPLKWSFCVRHPLIKSKIHLDPEKSISDNRIRENASVICERVIE